MRHLQRHQGITIRFLHDAFYPRDPKTLEPVSTLFSIEYVESGLQRADIFTKAFRNPVHWRAALMAIAIGLVPRGKDGKPVAVRTAAAAAVSGRGHATEGTAAGLSTHERDILIHLLEREIHEYVVKGSYNRTNRKPNAERDATGKLIEAIPSDVITGGPIMYLCRLLNPGYKFEFITVNKFTDASECQHHHDTGNKGLSRLSMFGDFEGAH